MVALNEPLAVATSVAEHTFAVVDIVDIADTYFLLLLAIFSFLFLFQFSSP
jgi:hypothetical protein